MLQKVIELPSAVYITVDINGWTFWARVDRDGEVTLTYRVKDETE